MHRSWKLWTEEHVMIVVRPYRSAGQSITAAQRWPPDLDRIAVT